MKLKRLAALVLAVMMTLAAASATGLSKLAAEGTQKPEKSVVDAAGATWYHADAGEELRFDDDSSYCFESESWIMRQKSGNTIDEAVFDGITPDNVQTLTDENGETYTVSMYSQATVVAALNRMLGKETKKPERTLVERYKIDDEGMIDVIIKLSGDAVLENGGAVLGEGLTKQQSAAREKLAAEHEIIKKRIECAASAISFEYDFGDGWIHNVRASSVSDEPLRGEDICVTSGKGACPPEDVGGVWGYAQMLDILSGKVDDPEEKASYEEWLGLQEGETYDPEEFDLEIANEDVEDLVALILKGKEDSR